MTAYFERFEICEAYLALENEWHVGGWLRERRSNQQRMGSTGCQSEDNIDEMAKRYADEQSEEDRERYAFAEDEAWAKRVGLWSDPDPVPPWEWRKKRQ